MAVLGVVALIYLTTVLPSLENDPIAGGDEGWIISSSAKLAREGVFGSDLFEGFYRSEDHYYHNLPLHHLILAGVFKAAPLTLATGRLVSVVFGLAALLLTYALGRRAGGPYVGLGGAALLVLLRLNLAPFSGLTLTDLGATVRYDLITLPLSLGAMLLVLRRPDSPGLGAIAGAGLLCGLAALTQFIGAFVAVPIGLFLLTAPVAVQRRLKLTVLFGAMMLLPFLPYFVYIAGGWEDFNGQARSVEQETDFTSLGFYAGQIAAEGDRYETSMNLSGAASGLSGLAERPSARLAMLVVGPAALLHALWRGRNDRGRLLIGMTAVALAIELALFESTKRFVYWVVVVPYLSIAVADLGLAAWQAVAWRPALRLATAAVAAVFLLEGLAVAAKDVRDASDAPSYAALERKLDDALPAGSIVIGDNRLWPAMQDQELRSLLLLFYHTNPRISRDAATDIPGAFERIGAEYILLSPLSREILDRLSDEDDAAFRAFMQQARLVETIEMPAYGPIEVYRLP